MSTSADDESTTDDESNTDGPPAGEPERDRRIDVVLPARTDMAATLRVICASLGADLGFSVDDIDDLRLAVNEIFTTAADAGVERLSVSFEPTEAAIGVRLATIDAAAIALDDLALTILRSVVDDLRLDGGVVEFVKSRDEMNG